MTGKIFLKFLPHLFTFTDKMYTHFLLQMEYQLTFTIFSIYH